MEVNIDKGLRINVDHAKFNEAVLNHVIYMGLRNILKDSHASIKKDDEDCATKSMALAQKKLDTMYAGEVRAASERNHLEPLEREARRICIGALQAYFKSKGVKLSSITTDQWAKMMDAKWENYIPQAQENLDNLAKAPKIDLSDLDL